MSALVPAYALYGEGPDGFPDDLHVETIPARAAMHDWRIRSHRHGALFQFFFIASGGGTAIIDSGAHALGPGSAIALPPLVVHAFDFTPGTEGHVVSVPTAVLDRLSHREGSWRGAFQAPLVLATGEAWSAEISAVLCLAHGEYNAHRTGRAEALAAWAGLILVWFQRALTARDVAAGSDAGLSGARLVQRFMAQLQADFRLHPSLSDRARRLGVSVPHLSRVCRQVTGCSALALTHERLALEARRYLAYTSMTVAEIAFSLGFEDPAYFSRFFARHVGVSPRAYRADPARVRPKPLAEARDRSAPGEDIQARG